MALPVFHNGLSAAEMDLMHISATRASNFLKAVSHEGRLMILCHLASGEKSTTELEDLLSARQESGRANRPGQVPPGYARIP